MKVYDRNGWVNWGYFCCLRRSFIMVVGARGVGKTYGLMKWLIENGKPFIYIRPAPKDHGMHNQIEGVFNRGDRVIVVEDLISTGGSVIEVVNALRDAGAEVLGIASIFTYGMAKGIARLEEEINTILTTEPYIYYELLLSPERTAERKEELNRAIDENRKFSEDLSMILRDIIAGGGVPLTWIQD